MIASLDICDEITSGEVLVDARRWYVAQTLVGKEAYATANLERQKFESFLPRFRKTVSHARKRREVLAPLFPGYVFVKFDPVAAPWRCINSTYGVRRLISGRDQTPVPVPKSVVEHFLSRCVGGILRSQASDFEPGQPVRILGGPLADRLAKIVECDSRGRVAVLLEIMGQDQILALRPSDLGVA